MAWKNIVKKDEDKAYQQRLKNMLEETGQTGMGLNKFNKAVDEVYTIINHFVEKGDLDYDKHLMEFTKIIDSIAKKLGD